MILFFPSRNAPITRQVKRMLLAIYTRVGGLCLGPPRATAAAAAAAAATAAAAAAQTKRRGAQRAPGVRRVIQKCAPWAKHQVDTRLGSFAPLLCLARRPLCPLTRGLDTLCLRAVLVHGVGLVHEVGRRGFCYKEMRSCGATI